MDKQSKSILAMALDPMCFPQVNEEPCFRVEGEKTYARTLQSYIEFTLEAMDTNDPTIIY